MLALQRLLKRTARSLVRQQTIGMIDYVRFPSHAAAWGGPFNGQPARQALFQDIIANVRPCAIIETGTYLGTTTEFMAGTGLPIYSVEANARNYGFARARFWRRRNIKLLQGDSRSALQELLEGPLRPLADGPLLFYLDAHWTEDLPLAAEIDIIFSRCQQAVIMVDDFQVPADPGYGYDDYGAGKALCPAYIEPAVSGHRLCPFFPSTPSSEEGGARRGCIVLAKQSTKVPALASIPRLRSVSESEFRCQTELNSALPYAR